MAKYKRDTSLGVFEPCNGCPTPGECRREQRCRSDAIMSKKNLDKFKRERPSMIMSNGERLMRQKIMK